MKAKSQKGKKLSPIDNVWWKIDRPTNNVIIVGVLILDRQLPFDDIRSLIEERLLHYDRFTQYVEEPDSPFKIPRWVDDEDFDIGNHIKHIASNKPIDKLTLQEFVSELASIPFDYSKPLWQIHYIENYEAGSALIVRLHHSIADGLALIQILLSVADEFADELDAEDDEQEIELDPLAKTLTPMVKAGFTAAKTFRFAKQFVRKSASVVSHPKKLVKDTAVATKSLGKILFIPPDRKTLLRTRSTLSKLVAWSDPIPLADVKAIGKHVDATINDVLISSATGALRRYLQEQEEKVEGMNLRALVPVNLRKPEDLSEMGNKFGLIFLSLPVGVEDPIERLKVLKERMDAIKGTPEAILGYGIVGLIGLTPAQIENIITKIFSMKASTEMTNVPGPREPLHLAGAKLTDLMFWVPTLVDINLGISIISYAGNILIGIKSDAGVIAEPEKIIAYFHKELDVLSEVNVNPDEVKLAEPAAESKESLGAPGQKAKPEQAGQPDAEPWRCRAITRSGERCKNRARAGYSTCYVHRNVVL